MLTPNKNVVINIPFLDSDATFIRSGTIANGSCFFSAVLQAYSHQFTRLQVAEQKEYIDKLRKKLAAELSLESWMSLSCGVISSILIQKELNSNICKYFEDTYDFKDVSEVDLQYLQVLKDVITQQQFESLLLPEIYSEGDPLKYKTRSRGVCTKYLLESKDIEHLDTPRKTKLTQILVELLENLIDASIDNSYETYKDELTDSGASVDVYLITYLMNVFDRDIYFINSKNREPYVFGDNPYKDRKSIILLWFEAGHYEVIGRLLEGNRIQREFEPDDPLIAKIRKVYDE